MVKRSVKTNNFDIVGMDLGKMPPQAIDKEE